MFFKRERNQKQNILDSVLLLISALAVFAIVVVLVNPEISGISNKAGALVWMLLVSVTGLGAYVIDYERKKPFKIKIIRFAVGVVACALGVLLLKLLDYYNWLKFPATTIVNSIYCLVILGAAFFVMDTVERKYLKYLRKQKENDKGNN